jgi:RNA polymerase sigma factor (sigma-70 family)
MTDKEFVSKLTGIENNMQRFAMSLVYNREDAEDLLQETYLKALTYKDKFEEYTNLKAWVFTIMKNTFINNYRKSIREKTTIDKSKDLFYINNLKESHLMQPEAEYSMIELAKAVNTLEPKFRIPFMMHIEGHKYKEIAKALNLKIGTVKSRIFFTRRRLMELFPEYAHN